MRSFLIILFLSLFTIQSWGVTVGRLVGPFMLINLVSHSSAGGVVDSSAQKLYESMNVPEKPSSMGPGKALNIQRQILNFVCNSKGQDAYQCAINIHKTEFSKLSPGKSTFEVQGEAARALFDQFHSQNGLFSFRDEAHQFGIDATPERFFMVYSAAGI